MSKTVDLISELFKTLLAPKEELVNTDGLTAKNLQAFLERKGISDFLLYRYYNEYEIDGKDMGVYTMADGRKGIIFQVFPNPYSSDSVEDAVYNLVDDMNVDDTVLYFNTFAGRNISPYLDNFDKVHSHTPNIKHPEVVKELTAEYHEFLKRGVNKSIVNGIDVRIKNFTSTIGILFPKETSIEKIRQIYFGTIGGLTGLSPINFSATKQIKLLKEMLNPDGNMEDWDSTYDQHKVMNRQATSANTVVKTNNDEGYFEVGTWKYKTLTTSKFPNDRKIINNFDFYNIFFDRFRSSPQPPLGCPFFVSLVVSVKNVEKSKEKALSKSRDDLVKTRKIGANTRKAHPELDGRYKEAGRNIDLMTNENQSPQPAMLSVTIMDPDENMLQEYSKNLTTRFKAKDWVMEEETFGNVALFCFLFGLSLQHHNNVEEFLQRFDILFTSNNAAIAPIFGNFAQNKMVEPYFDSNWQLTPFDPFSDASYNVSKTGMTGEGKSYGQCYSHIHCLGAGMKLRIIDRNKSYARFCHAVGGFMIDVAADPNISLNFFTNAKTKKVLDANDEETEEDDVMEDAHGNKLLLLHSEEVSGIVPIIGIAIGLNLVKVGKEQSAVDATDESYIASVLSRLVIKTFLLYQRNGKLEHTRQLIFEEHQKEKENGNIRQSELLLSVHAALFNVADPLGSHYSLFNKPGNINLDNDYVVLETGGLEGVMLDLVVTSLAFTIKREFWSDGPSRQKRIDIDEGWMYKDKPIVISVLEDNARTLRKSNSGQTFITQSILDYDTNDSMRTLFGSSAHKLLLGQSGEDIERIAAGTFFPLTPFKKKMFQSVKLKKGYWGESLHVSSAGYSPMLLKASPKMHYILAGADANGFAKYDGAKNKYGFSDIETARYLVAKDEKPTASEDELYQLAKTYKDSRTLSESEASVFWETELKNALINHKFKMRFEPIVHCGEKDKELFGYEVFSFVEHLDGSKSNYQEYFKWVKKFDYEEKIIEYVFHNGFKRIEEIEERTIHINIDSYLINNSFFLNMLEEKLRVFNIASRLVLELKDTATNNNMKELTAFIERFKPLGVRFAIDNVNEHYHKLSYIALLNVDFVKIDGSLIRKAMAEESFLIVLESILALAHNTTHNKEIIVTKLEKDEEIDFACKLNIGYFQGRKVDYDVFIQ